jgi:hypothetical protein
MKIEGKEYQVYREEEVVFGVAPQGEDVLVVRRCIECGDELLGTLQSMIDVPSPRCEEGHHYSRSGVHY